MSGWRNRAACRDSDPEMFFPVGDVWTGEANQRRAQAAKAVCGRCPVSGPCRDEARHDGDGFSVRGGTTPAERRKGRVRT